MRTIPVAAGTPSRPIGWLAAVFTLIITVACNELPSSADPRETSPPMEIGAAIAKRLAVAGLPRNGDADRTPRPVAAHLTNAAHADWIVDFADYPDGRLCGTGGCPLQVWARIDGGPHKLVFDLQVLGYRVEPGTGALPVLVVDLHGALCGGTGADPCRYRYAWQSARPGRDGAFEAAGRPGLPTRHVDPLVQAIPAIAPQGSTIASAMRDAAMACTRSGGSADLSGVLYRLPDLNGDHRPEMLFDARHMVCESSGRAVTPACANDVCATRLFVHGAEGWQVAWSSAPVGYEIEISDRGAAMAVRAADCDIPSATENTIQCARRSIRWNATARRFVEIAASDGARR